MTTTFDQAGFSFPGPEALFEFLENSQDRSESQPTPFGGSYSVYSDGHGGQLYAQRHPDGGLIGCNPHVQGNGRFRVTVQQLLPNPRHPLDGRVVVTMLDEEPGVPFVLDVPDFRLRACFLKPGTEATFQVAGFPIEPDGFFYAPDEAAFLASPFGKLAPSGAFIPSGMFQPGGGAINPPLPRAIMAGPIVSATLVPTDSPAWRCELKTLGGSATISAKAELFTDEPVAGGFLMGSFSMSALLIDPIPAPTVSPKAGTDRTDESQPTPRRGLLSRLRGR